jgi:hypothetical protein
VEEWSVLFRERLADSSDVLDVDASSDEDYW